MLHTKSQGHLPSGSGEKIFKGVLLYMVLVRTPGPFVQTFIPSSKGVSIWNLRPIILEDKMFENVDRRPDARVIGILLAHPWAFGSGELMILIVGLSNLALYCQSSCELFSSSNVLWSSKNSTTNPQKIKNSTAYTMYIRNTVCKPSEWPKPLLLIHQKMC